MAPSPKGDQPIIQASCPICHRTLEGQNLAEFPHFPFCSRRCKLLDLGRWLSAEYGIPAEEADAPEGSPEERELP
jgi:endogenous inhibitor of DNA gyrase (YacG/DUF329 family)